MTRTELLHLARQCTFSQGYSVSLASKLTSVSDVEREKTRLQLKSTALLTRMRWYCVLYTLSILVLLAAGLAALLLPSLRTWDTGALALSAVGLALVSGILAMNAADSSRAARGEILRISPMIRRDDCRQALEYVQAGQLAVLAWRDLAVAERGELYDFDLMVLRDLHFASIAVKKEAAAELAAAEVRMQLYSMPAHVNPLQP